MLYTLAVQRENAAKRISALMEEREWTHEDLAHKSGVAVKTISRVLNRKHDPRKNTRDSIAAALGTTNESIWERPAPLGIGAEQDPYQEQLDRIEAMLGQLLEATETPQQRAKDAARAADQRSKQRKTGSQAGQLGQSKRDQAS